MLDQVLKSLTPDFIVSTIKANPQLVPSVLQKFEAFKVFSNALDTKQQVYISNNMDKLALFFQEKDVKEAIGILADAFITKTTSVPEPQPAQPAVSEAKIVKTK